MAKEKKRRKKKGFTVPLAVVAGFMPIVGNYQRIRGQGFTQGKAAVEAAGAITGYSVNSSKWSFQTLREGGSWGILAGMIVHKVASRVGINRALASAGIPFIRI